MSFPGMVRAQVKLQINYSRYEEILDMPRCINSTEVPSSMPSLDQLICNCDGGNDPIWSVAFQVKQLLYFELSPP